MVSGTPRVTVLMPVWNGAAYLGAALDSLCAQTFSDFELLVVDDGSTDATPAILKEYARRDRRIRVTHEAHAGQAGALNRGLELAKGTYIARMDADDLALPQRLAVQVAFMDAHPDVGLCGTWVTPIGASRRRSWRVPTHDADIRCRMLFESTFLHSSVMLRRADFIQQGLRYEAAYEPAEDYALWVRCAQQSHFRLANIPRPLIWTRLHDARMSHQFADVQMANARRLRSEQLAWLGLSPSAAQLALHEAIAAAGSLRYLVRDPATPTFITEAEAWLQTLRAANERLDRHPRVAFARTLANRWARICARSASTGVSPWLLYWRSSLARAALPTWRATVVLTGASLLRWRLAAPALKRLLQE
jgi:glycosyltransferase involved in cell wall biosynthesis